MKSLPIFTVIVCAAACMPAGRAPVSPEQLPDLEARVQAEPGNGDAQLRYAAALSAANQCDSATAVARRGQALRPTNSLGPLVIGQCAERDGRWEEAIRVYESFAAQHPDARGIAAVRARELLARRTHATQLAREALAADTAGIPSPQTVAVLPLAIAGDSVYQPLSRGLAQMITSDLGLLQRFQLVERMRLGALLDEMRLAQSDRVDPSTAARVGRLMQAGRMVQGLAAIPEGQAMRLEASVVLADGQVAGPEVVTGRFRDLMGLEKELVVRIAGRLGYQLSAAERQLILENGTRSLTAFLAYSRGLEEEALGNFPAAASFYSTAVQADPGFQQARTSHQAAEMAPAVQRAAAGAVTTLATTVVRDPSAFGGDAVRDALNGVIGDLASTAAEQATETGNVDQIIEEILRQPSGTTISGRLPNDPFAAPIGTIRIIFRLP